MSWGMLGGGPAYSVVCKRGWRGRLPLHQAMLVYQEAPHLTPVWVDPATMATRRLDLETVDPSGACASATAARGLVWVLVYSNSLTTANKKNAHHGCLGFVVTFEPWRVPLPAKVNAKRPPRK